ncbi:MAG: S9 family peptidase [Candidatus Eremiobacteraeota bacterium]|nr:S9 family peptidase [Candidatus Eremiobacteraeota bacterium]
MRVWLLCSLTVCFALAPAQSRTLQSSDIARTVSVEQPAIAPDGSRIAYVVVRSDTAHNTYVRELHAIAVATRRDTLLVRDDDVSLPRWSPDGRTLAFLDRRSGAMCVMVWRGSKAVSIARAQGDVNDFAWRPDGRAVAFSAYDAAPATDYFEAGDNDYTQTAPIPPVHLWLTDLETARTVRLTHGSWTLTPTDSGGMFVPAFSWSHDGRRIAFARLPNTFTGEDERSTLYELDVATGTQRKLTSHPAVEFGPAYSPDGGTLAYSYARDGNFLALNTLRVRRGGDDEALAPAFDRDLGAAIWMPGGRSMLACGNDATHSRAYSVQLSGSIQPIDLGGLEITCDAYQSSTFDAGIAASVSASGGLAFVATDRRHLRELYYIPARGTAPQRLTHFNDVFNRVTLGRIAPIAWTGSDGFREYGVLHYPPNPVAGRRYPIVVVIHGGPGLSEIESFAGKSYGGDWPIEQLIAAHGYLVFAPNYRGSDDAGNAFLLGIVGDTVVGPARDITEGLAAVKALPEADASRTAVCGWSYGGLLTSWLIGQDRSWKAAVSGAAVNVESQSYDLSVSNVQDAYYQGGVKPYTGDGSDRYRAVSPITYAKNVTTPTLIWGTTRDPVVPITMSYAFYHALHDNGAPVKFVVFDAPTHGPNAPRNTRELTDLWLGWLDAHL